MARALVQSKIAKELRTANGGASEDDGLPPGHMRLYSYYKPALEAGLYGIEATQTIRAIAGNDKPSKAQALTVFNSQLDADNKPAMVRQEFRVVAPQFSLDPKLIDTYYPPAGHRDEAHVLPHIVFNDPHVPWFREAGLSHWMRQPIDTADANDKLGHNFVPWMGLLVFQPDELVVDDATAGKLGLKAIKTKDGTPAYDATKLPANGAFPMAVGDYLRQVTSRVYYEKGYTDTKAAKDFKQLKDSTEVMSAIFPTKSQLKAVMLDKDGDLAPLQAQKMLAHVRHINTIGFPDAGVEEEGFFSVVVSSMTGNQKETTPSTHIVHLVSLEHLDATLTDPDAPFAMDDTPDRVGLVSLFSWTYTCIPDSINFYDTMEALGQQAQPLRPPKEALEKLQTTAAAGPSQTDPNSSLVAKALHDRLTAGYTIARWRVPTGEESAAFNRGPLVPILTQEVPTPPAAGRRTAPWPALSMTGRDYAVLDRSVGITDASYSSAWSLGKLMAISDSVFNAAIMRFRSTIWQAAASVARMDANKIQPAASVLSKSATAVVDAAAVARKNFTGPVSRINKPADLGVATSTDDPQVVAAFRKAIVQVIGSSANSGSGDKATMYNGFDGAPGNNSDWEVLLNWIHDAMYLATIPAHVLFPEPSHLQSHNMTVVALDQPKFHPEALRFFHIDHAWIDCFLDGALSCANHLEPEYDYTRLCIKAVFNEYLKTPIGKTGIRPPVPRYGFIIRSAAIKTTPDLRLTVTCWMLETKADGTKTWVEDPKRDPLVRHTKMDDFSILSLVDCSPDEICAIRFAQPPHQQRFSLSSTLTYDRSTGLVAKAKADVKLTRLFTDKALAPPVLDPYDNSKHVDAAAAMEWRTFEDSWIVRDGDTTVVDQKDFYNDTTRCIDAVKITQTANDKLNLWAQGDKFNGKPPYQDAVASSCVFGLEMNDSSVQLEITNAPPTALTPFPEWTRQLWVGPDISGASNTAPRASGTGSSSAATPKPSAIVPPSSISIPPHNPTLATPQPPRTLLNGTKPIPRALAAVVHVAPPIRAGAVDPFINSKMPQFELLIHPDYRPPPPRPKHTTTDTGFSNDVYSPLNYLPTGTDSLYDLIFAIRRRNQLDTKMSLQSLTIEIPVSDGLGDKPDAKGWTREPLLDSGDYSGTGVRMCSNTRFVPALFSGEATTVGSSRWDGKPVLGIRLVPRSGSTTGTIPLAADRRAVEAGVRLGEPRLHPVVDQKTTALVAQGVDPKTGKTGNKQLPRGRCMVRLIEHYGNNRTDEWSWCVALKVDGGDVDPWGNRV